MSTLKQSPLKSTLDDALADVTTGSNGPDRVAGVAAAVTRSAGPVYEGAAGVRSLNDVAPMTTDSVFAMFSTTKAITGTTVLQCVEEGLLDLDAPASDYIPEIADLCVAEGFDDAGALKLRAPNTPITTRMLLLHTAGFGYSFFDETYHRLLVDGVHPSVITATRAALNTPLLFEPGTRWNYGSNIDWAGLVVEAIRGKRLGKVMAERVFRPLGMSDTAFRLTPSMEERRTEIHQRGADGTLEPTGLVLPQEPEVDMGGHGLYSTVGDYSRFLRMWLNDGEGEHGRVLRPETVANAAVNGLGDLQVTMLPGVEPELSNDAEFFPGQRKTWAYTFMVNEEQAPTGRSAGSLSWAGLANLYYWIDRSADVAGIWATQILPFADRASVDGFLEFESRVYRSLD
ncbi:serine hydrolase domain-containing protein [Rhodococcus artemisiae]|uniref:Serine hydrolase domain-containing protein n=1 Tax=Rhodococcus artemisiae TaxID=714159 RepID=A0ABU7LGJ4_9NOCA|nr:serine hydrolase domain-containing protein [Rhodococcus artemisiae]MEE2060671.1 serine hydrolase domain-containing protein [Rhodococcus artemisiae]